MTEHTNSRDCKPSEIHDAHVDTEEESKRRVSITKVMVLTMWASIIGFIGVSLPKNINYINGLSENAFYGEFASYVFSSLLFWLFMKDYSLMTDRESYFNQLKKIFKKRLAE